MGKSRLYPFSSSFLVAQALSADWVDTPLRKMGETGIGVGTKPVEIQNLSFNYVGDGKPVLTVDEFHVEEGEAVLVIGKSGGWKVDACELCERGNPSRLQGERPGGCDRLWQRREDHPPAEAIDDDRDPAPGP